MLTCQKLPGARIQKNLCEIRIGLSKKEAKKKAGQENKII